jgi:AcrR family transcriptional regulator
MTPTPATPTHPEAASTARSRILDAAFAAFTERGYTQTSTLEIATRARVSKRELYALVGNKQDMLVACITERARRMRLPAQTPVPRDRETLAQVLASFGAQVLREVNDPAVVAVFRLAIGEAERAPEIARALDSIGRQASRSALRQLLEGACSSGIVAGAPAQMVEQFFALLWGDLMMGQLLRTAAAPSGPEIERRGRDAAAALLQLYGRSGESDSSPPRRR